MKTLVIDLDGTVCEEKPTFEKSLAKPIKDAVKTLRDLYWKGWRIIIYTARGWAEYEMTRDWLSKNDILYDQLIMGKPIYTYWIDDRAIKFESWSDIKENLLEESKCLGV